MVTPIPSGDPFAVPFSVPSTSAEQLVNNLQLDTISSDNPISITKYHFSVSESTRLARAQEIIAKFSDLNYQKTMYNIAYDSAFKLSNIISNTNAYNHLKSELNDLGLQDAQDAVNDAIDDLQNSVDESKVTDLNTAAATYDSAQAAYRAALQPYYIASNFYNSALNAYQTALTAWNTALQSGDESAIATASANFETAEATFNAAETTYAAEKTTFETAETNWINAKANVDAKITAYNTEISRPEHSNELAALATAVANWNAIADQANAIIDQMNGLSDTLSISDVTKAPHIDFGTTAAALQYPTLTASGNETLQDLVAASVNTAINKASTVNAYITSPVNPNITSVNSTFSTSYELVPAITSAPEPTASGFSQYPTLPITPYQKIVDISYTPEQIDPLVGVSSEVVLLDFAFQLAIRRDEDDSTDTSPLAKRNLRSGEQNIDGGSGASVQLTTINQKGTGSNPFTESTLSRQAMEAVLNVYGVPIGSALVDQMSALVQTFAQTNGLVSTALAQDLLSSSSLYNGGNELAVRYTLALATLTNLTGSVFEGALSDALKSILEKDSTFSALQPADQQALINSLTQEVGGSLLKAALSDLSARFGMPGLLPQLLLIASGLTSNDALGSLQSQLFFEVIFAQELKKTLGLPEDVATEIARKAVAQAAQTPEGITPASVTNAAIDALNAEGISSTELNAQIVKAETATRERVADQIAAQDQAQNQAFADSLTRSLLGKGILDQTQAARLSQELTNATSAQLGEIALRVLREFNLNQEEIRTILAEADRAAAARNGEINPAGALISSATATPSSLEAAFVENTRALLAPAVGDAQALSIAQNYGRLIFSSPNSILVRLQDNERQLSSIATYNQEERLYDDYRDYTSAIRNPLTATGNPLMLGETLLLSANIGGPATAGTTSLDNQLGVFGGININPGGILS
jgi:hypothetical protein